MILCSMDKENLWEGRNVHDIEKNTYQNEKQHPTLARGTREDLNTMQH